MIARRPPHPSAWLCWAIYAVLALPIFVEQFGRTTSDTRLDMTENPTGFLVSSLSLWNPRVSLGELQNQAYGYLFPQGLYFAGAEAAGVAGWVAERAWSVIVLVLACEGMRRLARAMMLNPWGAAVAGLFYGLSPRIVAEMGVRSAEMLPTAVIPWALIPIIHVATGRRGHRSAAVLSAAAFAFSGGVNGTATLGPLPIVGIFVLWLVLRRDTPWTFLLWWGGTVAAVSLWWLVSLLTLGRYSPPFFDYVEDAKTTTTTSGFAPSLRGASNWVNYIIVGDHAWWPAGYDVSFNPWIVLGSGLVAAVGLIGLARYRGAFQAPLLVSAAVGLTGLVIGHTGFLTGPLSPHVQDLLDAALAPFRNVHKVDPMLRIPLAVGIAATVGQVLAARRRRAGPRYSPAVRRSLAGGLTILLGLSLAAMSWPILNGNLRTPGWEEIPDYWRATADFLDDQPGDGAAWIVPGSGFGIQTWGWTMEEPMQVLGDSPWVTRSQVPLTPASSIRMQSSLESLIETGSGSPHLGDMLDRIGVEYIVVRHDLDPAVSESTLSSLVSIALARSSGIEKVAQFGRVDFGPAIEVFEVAGVNRAGFSVRDVDDVVTVASGVEDAMTAIGAGLVGDDQAVMVRGDSGWDEPADVVGDGYRLRERNFGRVHDAESAVMAPGEPLTLDRVVSNYPGAPGAEPVVADYHQLASVRASTSAGYADVLGPVRPENAPFAALDGDRGTQWESGYLTRPEGQWLDIDFGRDRRLGTVEIDSPPNDLGLTAVRKWRIVSGKKSVVATADPFTGRTVVDLDGAVSDRLRLEVEQVSDPGTLDQVAITEVRVPGVVFQRSMALPDVPDSEVPDYLFAARPETRSCIPTLLGPDCSAFRERASEESTGIDRTFTVRTGGRWAVDGLAVARSRPGTARLLDPLGGMTASASSWLGNDPTVSARMAYDGDPTTSWIADPRDPRPRLKFVWPTRQKIRQIGVSAPADPATVPTRAIVRTRSETRVVDLHGDGTLSPPIEARKVRVTFRRPGDQGYTTLGVGDVYLGGKRFLVPLDGAVRTGSVCGFGPPLVVDGVVRNTRVDGFIGDVVSAGQMAVHPCGGPLRLSAGQHRIQLQSTEQFQPVSLELTASRRSAVSSSRSIRLVSSSDDRQVLQVSEGEDAVVSVPRNFNEGWVAELDGKRLEPLQVDGWAQGWRIPADLAGELTVTFAPQAGYRRNLLVGLGLLALVLVAAGVLVVLRRLRPEAVRPERRPWRARRGRAWAGALVIVAYLVGGPVVLAGAVLALVLRSRPLVLQAIATAALLAGVVVAAAVVATDIAYPPDSADLLTGFGAAMLLVWGAVLPPVVPGHASR